MNTSRRQKRVASLIKEEVSRLLIEEVQDSFSGLITVTKVDMTADLRTAHIYLSIFGIEQADAIFNFGHSRPKGIKFPDNIHFFEIQVKDDIPDFVPEFERIGLVYVIQYKESIKKYAEKLKEAGKKVVLGGTPDFMATYESQVTGCDIGAARQIAEKVDGFVVACDGLFHANAVAALDKPTFNWFGETAEAPKFPMAALFAAKKVAILTGIKPGQNYQKEAEKAREKLEEMGKKVIMVAGDVLTPEINNFRVDFWITAACPRIPEDDFFSPSAPVQEVLKYL